MKPAYKLVRVLTIAPLMALALLTALCLAGKLPGPEEYALSLLFLTVFPVLPYPLQKLSPRLRAQGRAGQRKLAMLGAVAGYACGLLYVLLAGAGAVLTAVFLTYLLSGAALALINKFTRLKASGHACGIAGPIAAAALLIGRWAFCGLAVWLLAFWASVKSKRHTVPEYLAGSAVPVAMLLVSALAAGLLPR